MMKNPRSTTPGPCMTLAVAILLFGISSAAQPAMVARQDAQSAPASARASSSANIPATQDGATPPQGPAETKPSAAGSTPKAAPASHGSTTAKKPHHKKKSATSGCDPVVAQGATPVPDSPGTAPNSPTAGTPQDPVSGQSTAPKDCPPTRVVVRQGGTAEPSIQLAGGPAGNQASEKRDAANQLLELTEGNLKKIAGRQLSTTQQDALSQIRQFVDQSKAALAAGDSERAHTLAWKAKLLSEDLVKPPQ